MFRSTEFGDDKDRALKKGDDSWTYFAGDLAYHNNKISRNFDILINILGADHSGYIKRISSVVDALSKNKQKTVEFSDKLKDIDFDIRSFLRKNMYDHKDVQKRNDEGKKIVNFLFKKLQSNTNNNFSIQNFDQNKSRSVADFISGMTDRYAINLYEELK